MRMPAADQCQRLNLLEKYIQTIFRIVYSFMTAVGFDLPCIFQKLADAQEFPASKSGTDFQTLFYSPTGLQLPKEGRPFLMIRVNAAAVCSCAVLISEREVMGFNLLQRSLPPKEVACSIKMSMIL